MSKSVMTEEMIQAMKPEWNAPFVVALCSDTLSPSPTGLICETGLGFMAHTRLWRSAAIDFEDDEKVTPERLLPVREELLHSGTESWVESRSKL